jgi:hypothetical protein
MTLIRELLDLPKAVRKGDFVLSLNKGIENPNETLEKYAITPNLQQTFGRVISIIDSALSSGRSQAVYLHGSFGSGKSHFMAVLDLMLAGHSAPWGRPELHPLREKYDWVGKRKLLRLPLHMLGANSTEEKIFDAYVKHVLKYHPDADIPALYADQELFDNARGMRDNMGDDRFFEILNEGAPKSSSGWGKLADEATWTVDRFESAINSSNVDSRAELFSALVKTHFTAFAGQTHRFIGIDEGLAVMSRHAATLGYQGIVLYLDELILWLAGRSANMEWMQSEVQKIPKFKEAQDEERDIPIVTFIARQRDLSEMLGRDAVGIERQTMVDSIEHHSGRLEEVMLEDRNLPSIIERRVLRPKDDTSAEVITDGFEKMKRSASDSWATLLGKAGDIDGFRKTYPFSPALIEVLVGLSDCLQRERTAIRLLMELLVEHLTELELGQVVPLGDIYDVIAGGDDAFDALMKSRFDRAKHVYRHQLLGLIHDANDTGTPEACQRLRDDHPAWLGCSACKQTACRNDNRLAKTLILAALIPNAKPFEGLTAKRLVQLNHGTVTTFIPGTEGQMAVGKLRKWASELGQLKVGEEADPLVSLQLDGVDLKPIMEQAQQINTPGARRNLLKQLLFEAMELSDSDTPTVEDTHTWQGTRRKGQIRFGNIRELRDEQLLRCPDGAEWYVIVDYPFDHAEHTPDDDLERIAQFREEFNGSNPSFAWLPSFFTDKLVNELGEVCVINHILLSDQRRKYLSRLRPEDQSRAINDLESLGNQKRSRVMRALGQAYGIGGVKDDGMIDPTRSVEEHVVSLQPGLEGKPLMASSFRTGLLQLVSRLLEHRYPHHRAFEGQVTIGKLEKVRQHLEKLLETQDRRMPISAMEHKELRGYAEPLELVVLSETVVELKASRINDIEAKMRQSGIETPTVGQVREFVDPEGSRGLVAEAADLVVWAFAAAKGFSITRAGKVVQDLKLGRFADDMELVKPDLPSASEWHDALEKAGQLLGVTFAGRALNAQNLDKADQRIGKALKEVEAAAALPVKLRHRLQEGWAHITPPPPRLTTAQSGADLLLSLGTRCRSACERIRNLAAFEPLTSGAALASSLRSARQVSESLGKDAEWMVLAIVRDYQADATKAHRAEGILHDLKAALESDQLNVDLVAKISELIGAANALKGQKKETARGASGWQDGPRLAKTAKFSADIASAERAIADIAKDLEDNTRTLLEENPQSEFELHWQASYRRRKAESGGVE